MFRNLYAFAVALVGVTLAGCAGGPATSGSGSVRPTGPIPPYAVHAAELDEASGVRLLQALRAIEGVEGVELDLEARRADVQSKPGSFLYEPQVRAAFAAAELELAAFEPPSEAMVAVYVVEASGGG